MYTYVQSTDLFLLCLCISVHVVLSMKVHAHLLQGSTCLLPLEDLTARCPSKTTSFPLGRPKSCKKELMTPGRNCYNA